MTENDDHQVQLERKVLLSVQRALLGEVTANLRGVTVGWKDNQVSAIFVYDGEITLTEIDIVADVEAEVRADFPDEWDINFVARQSDADDVLNNFTLTFWVYKRKE